MRARAIGALLAVSALMVAACNDAEELLLPYADRIVVIDRALVCLGSVSRALGLLAGVLGDHTTAESHLRRALVVHEAMGARPLTARTRVELARLLGAHHPTTPEIAEQLSLARATASQLGMTRLLAQTKPTRILKQA